MNIIKSIIVASLLGGSSLLATAQTQTATPVCPMGNEPGYCRTLTPGQRGGMCLTGNPRGGRGAGPGYGNGQGQGKGYCRGQGQGMGRGQGMRMGLRDGTGPRNADGACPNGNTPVAPKN